MPPSMQCVFAATSLAAAMFATTTALPFPSRSVSRRDAATTVYTYPGTITRSQEAVAVSEPSRSDLKLAKDFTVSIWANPSQRVGDWVRVLGKGSSYNRNFGLWIHPDGRVLSQVYGPTTGTNVWNFKGANAPLNTWTHVAATFSAGKQHTLYINGAPVGSLRTTGTPRTDNEPLTLGKAAFHTGFAGSLAKARVSAFAMSAAQVKAEFASGKPNGVYPNLAGNFQCPKENHLAQTTAHPSWRYDTTAPSAGKQAVKLAWEPILEPVEGCNGLADGWVKEFKFLTVLDASWVQYYNENTQHFAAQGYPTLESSPSLMIDRVSYLFEKQFGVRISAGRVHAFADLGEACATNNKHVDDGTDETSTVKRLAKAGITPLDTEAGTMRLGVGSPDVYCHSTSPVPGLCNQHAILTNQKKPFATDGSGKLHYGAVTTLAHEMAHFFGVCPRSNPHCLNAHSINELADIMVDDGRPSINARPTGMFRKFMTTCTPLYDDTVCSNVKAADATCGVAVPPVTISGEYINTRYGARSNDWHFVTIAEVVVTGAAAGSSYTWTNKAGVSWALTRDNYDATLFHVGATCPYYSTYKTTRLVTDSATGKPVGLYGPHNELYTIKSAVKASNPVFCPDGSTDATCWADSAFQQCSQNRQGAYDRVMVAKTGGQDAMHEAFRTLVGGEYGCTKPAKRDKHTSCPRWTQYCTRGAWVSWMAVNCPATCSGANSGRV